MTTVQMHAVAVTYFRLGHLAVGENSTGIHLSSNPVQCTGPQSVYIRLLSIIINTDIIIMAMKPTWVLYTDW